MLGLLKRLGGQVKQKVYLYLLNQLTVQRNANLIANVLGKLCRCRAMEIGIVIGDALLTIHVRLVCNESRIGRR